ncbi:SPOR domain-containing protein [Devosia salina]|uniref:SPOR domain-containing protein n=1 Tax=Devosia salina TaxID=2860336 RepID=A0ABX8WHC7_9HYPH|nr:SPOR domain-containing protein [Devosia salina]QYO78278.1 SPOR domain-containing protein [Devosia salina]
MAAQTEAPDDLIAELARLMADDARVNQPPANEPAAPVRIPGDSPATPAPRFDFSANDRAKAPSSPVRIPGGDAGAGQGAEPFAFDFEIGRPATTAAPVSPVPAGPAPTPPRAENPKPPAEEPAALDQDSLADLIAAELAADMAPEPAAPEAEAQSDATPDADNFGVPPVFGLGSANAVTAPVAPAPQAEPQAAAVSEPELPEPPRKPDDGMLDPLDEIERLVGPAVRMNAANPAPALRSLATPTLPEPSPAAPPETQATPKAATPAADPAIQVNSVDEAILAAAAATGAHVEWVNAGASEPDEVSVDETYAEPARAAGFRLNRAVVGPLVAVGLLAVAGFGLYWALGQGGGSTGPAPLLVADTTPTKEVPEADVSATTAQSVVFNEISGTDAPADEQIVSRDQADTEAVVAANSPVSISGVIADADGGTVDPNQDGLVNRKVRTVTVRPDGTIVSGVDSLAGSSILPVDRPNVPDVPGADFSTPDLIASAATDAGSAAPAASAETTPVLDVAVAEPGAVIPVVDAAGAPVAGRSVTMPMQRPDDFAALAASAIAAAQATPLAAAPAASTPVAAAPAPAATSAVTPAAAYVQMASQRSEEAARQSAQAVATRYGVLFSGVSPEIQRVDLGERGIYYRVLVPAASRESAANICTNVKAAGGDCLLL